MFFDSSKLALIFQQLADHSLNLQKDENVLIESVNISEDILVLLFRQLKQREVNVFFNLKYDKLIREINLSSGYDYFNNLKMIELFQLKKMDAFIGIRSSFNTNELNDIPASQIKLMVSNYYKPVHLLYRNNNLKSVFLRIPNESMAQSAGISSDLILNQFYDSCLFNYSRLDKILDPFVELLKKTNHVRITGPGETDINFSKRNMPVLKCVGKRNMPDGEVQTVPVKNSVNGTIGFNVVTTYLGTTFHSIRLEIKNGRIVDFDTSNNKIFERIINLDKGSRYFGEFAFGLNSAVKQPLNDILYDEKMQGTVHLALGNAYSFCDNGNRSSIHWDLIVDQNTKKGGGEIYCDNKLIRKNGKFVINKLKVLNN